MGQNRPAGLEVDKQVRPTRSSKNLWRKIYRAGVPKLGLLELLQHVLLLAPEVSRPPQNCNHAEAVLGTFESAVWGQRHT